MKYLKTWMGVVESTGRGGMGDNSGHPERKFALIESLDDLISSYAVYAEYYRLERVEVDAVIRAVKDLGEHQ